MVDQQKTSLRFEPWEVLQRELLPIVAEENNGRERARK